VTVALAPLDPSVAPGGTITFTATVTGASDPSVTWSVDGVAGGNAASGTLAGTAQAGRYTAPSLPGVHTVTATSLADSSRSASTSVTIQGASGGVSVTLAGIGPARAVASGTSLLTATVSGSPDTTVTWSVDGIAGGSATVGTIASPVPGNTVLYRAPSSPGSHAVTATSAADPTRSASITLAVTGAVLDAASIPVGANVKDAPYNAKGDGTSNDTAAIMAAVKAVAGSGKAVVIPAGTYRIDATANSGAGIRLGSDMTLLMQAGAVLKALPSSTQSYSVVYVGGCSNVNISGGTILGNNGDNTIPVPTNVEDGNALEITGARNVVVEGVTVGSAFNDGVYVAEDSSDILFNAIVSDGNRRSGMSIVYASRVAVLNSTFRNTTGAVEVAGQPMINGNGLNIEVNANQTISTVLIGGCTFTDNFDTGLCWGVGTTAGQRTSTNAIFADGNTFSGNSTGLSAEYSPYSCITRNQVSKSSAFGIYIHDGSQNTYCAGNTVTGTGSAGDFTGIECYNDTGTILDANTSTGNAKYGIRAANSSGITITNNVCTGNPVAGIRIDNSTVIANSGNSQ
jgi:parallel beta-helix repeat protein